MALSLAYIRTLIVLCLALVSATESHPTQNYEFHKTDLSTYHLPLSNGSASLPSSPHGTSLKAITLGRGTQNYTCQPKSVAPNLVGAVADLYDLSHLLQFIPIHEATDLFNLLPNYLIDFSLASLDHTAIPQLGHHYFDAAGIPTFDLGSDIGVLKGKRDVAIAAPKCASKGAGNQGDGAVDWLALCGVEGSHGLSFGYRVETAGGKASNSCNGQPEKFEVQYAALYAFFH